MLQAPCGPDRGCRALFVLGDFHCKIQPRRTGCVRMVGHSETGPKWVLGEIQSREVPSRQVGGKRAQATSPGAASRVASASPGIPRRHGGTRRASPDFIPPPKLPLPRVPPGAVLRAPGRFRSRGGCRGYPGLRRAPRRATAPSPTTISTRRSRSPSHQCRQPTTRSARPRSPMQDDEPHRQMTALGELKVTGFLLICRFYH